MAADKADLLPQRKKDTVAVRAPKLGEPGWSFPPALSRGEHRDCRYRDGYLLSEHGSCVPFAQQHWKSRRGHRNDRDHRRRFGDGPNCGRGRSLSRTSLRTGALCHVFRAKGGCSVSPGGADRIDCGGQRGRGEWNFHRIATDPLFHHDSWHAVFDQRPDAYNFGGFPVRPKAGPVLQEIFGGNPVSQILWAIGVTVLLQFVLVKMRWGSAHDRHRRQYHWCQGSRHQD